MGKVVVIGDLNVDVLCNVKSMPEREKEVHADSIGFSIGGNAANFAVALGKLGVKPEFCSCIGNDFSSGFLRNELESSGVRARLREVSGSNGYSIAFVFRNGSRRFVSNKGASDMLRPGDVMPAIEGMDPGDILYAGGVFHLPGLAKGFAGIAKQARKMGVTVMFDSSADERGCSGSFGSFARYLDMAFMNQEELKCLGGGGVRDSLKALSEMGIRDVIVKMGSGGSMFYTGGMTRKEPAVKAGPVDPVGTGDVFNAGFVYGFMSGLLPEQCLRLGNWLASWKLAKAGIAIPERDKVLAFVRKMK